MEILVRRAASQDSRDIFEWRNDNVTKKMSHNTDPITWADHEKWFNSSVNCKTRALYICYTKGTNESIAIVVFDIDNDNALISINLSPARRGQNLSKTCLRKAIDELSSANNVINQINAEIKLNNTASQRSFKGIGFEVYKIQDNLAYLRRKLSE